MASSTPSSRSFFSSHSLSPQRLTLTQPDDESAYSQSQTTVGSLTRQAWKSSSDYIRYEIADLLPGPGRVSVSGRIANIFDLGYLYRMPYGAKGCLKLLVKDDTGLLTVKLWYTQPPIDLHLGRLITLWAAHVSSSETGDMPIAIPSTALCVTLFPARDRSSHIEVHEEVDILIPYMMPLGWTDEPDQLISLREFIAGGHEIREVKILIIVKSIGSRKKMTRKSSSRSYAIHIDVLDNTAEATLTLFDTASQSATSFQPSQTVLLLTTPGINTSTNRPTVYINANTLIEINPSIPETTSIRKLAARLTQKTPTNPPYPTTIFNPQIIATGSVRALYTLADLDSQARSSSEAFDGYLSVLILDVGFTRLHGRNMLFSDECCGQSIYKNEALGFCTWCESAVDLRLDPAVIGAVVDETGRVDAGGLVWSDDAWQGIFGRMPDEVGGLTIDVLREIEKDLMMKRVTLVFGWAEEVGRIAIARVML